ncbi:NADP-dependent oxidoreductase domain-containing protein [Protomyces lactucae-debilis]|uniref:NADP-dependent oxidoreductase domain-containing protein n=1 Tax=Protomyces lactucae-debilis TaxID=2754530 RepID=A0A1Y2EY05_PROLT|nr:NADP-dependent oxidoreductase domain-containing protein [Protomyces lactucae-debilis]ORY76367.1 NADP-dependent oxidoreductase domain-containing protein [Protomyces lactucae-debilis]
MVQDIPQIGYGIGTAWFKKEEGDVDRALVDAVKIAIDVGYRHFDNAEVYRNERDFGVAWTEHGINREDLWITTKVHMGVADAVGALKASLEKLQTLFVDLYLIHMPYFDDKGEGKIEDVWQAMEQCVDLKLAKHIGVSNFRVKDIQRVLKVATKPVFANQVECHPYHATPGLHDLMKQHGIRGESYGPLVPMLHAKDGPLSPYISELAKKYSRSEGLILLRWNIQKGNIIITTSSKRDRMKEQLTVADFELDAADVARIDELGSQHSFTKFFDNPNE